MHKLKLVLRAWDSCFSSFLNQADVCGKMGKQIQVKSEEELRGAASCTDVRHSEGRLVWRGCRLPSLVVSPFRSMLYVQRVEVQHVDVWRRTKNPFTWATSRRYIRVFVMAWAVFIMHLYCIRMLNVGAYRKVQNFKLFYDVVGRGRYETYLSCLKGLRQQHRTCRAHTTSYVLRTTSAFIRTVRNQ